VDSVIALFRVDFSGRGELAERQVLSIFVLVETKKNHKVVEGLKLCTNYSELAAKIGTDALPPY
jgi:hypothetical protein